LGHHVLFEGRWQGQALQQRIFNCSLQIPSTDGRASITQPPAIATWKK
jgi:hypothetical protein